MCGYRSLRADPSSSSNKLSKTLNFERASANGRVSGSAVMTLLVMLSAGRSLRAVSLSFRRDTSSLVGGVCTKAR